MLSAKWQPFYLGLNISLSVSCNWVIFSPARIHTAGKFYHSTLRRSSIWKSEVCKRLYGRKLNFQHTLSPERANSANVSIFTSDVVITMMTSSNENIFRVTGPLWGESTGHRWIPLTKASEAELWCFLWSAPEQTVEQTIETPVNWDAIALIMTSL